MWSLLSPGIFTRTITFVVFVSGTFDLLNTLREQCPRTAFKLFLYDEEKNGKF